MRSQPNESCHTSPRRFVLTVDEARLRARGGLDQHVESVVDQLLRTRRVQRDTALAGQDLPRNSNDHDWAPALPPV